MKISDAINKGIECMPSKTAQALAGYLGIDKGDLSSARTGKRGLEEKACVRLAELVGEPPLSLIPESRAITAKDEETRQFWMKYAKAAAIGPFAAMSFALVTMIVTPADAQAAPLHQQKSSAIHIM